MFCLCLGLENMLLILLTWLFTKSHKPHRCRYRAAAIVSRAYPRANDHSKSKDQCGSHSIFDNMNEGDTSFYLHHVLLLKQTNLSATWRLQRGVNTRRQRLLGDITEGIRIHKTKLLGIAEAEW